MKYLLILASLLLSSCSFLLNEKKSDNPSPTSQSYSVVINSGSAVISGIPSDPSKVKEGTVLTLTVVLPEGFRVRNWVGVCESITSNICSFTVLNNISVSVVLEPVVRQLTLIPSELSPLSYQIDSEAPVVVSSSTVISVNVGQRVSISANLVDHAEISAWQNSYGITSTSAEYSFSMPDQDVSSSPSVICSERFVQNGSQCDLDVFKIVTNNLSLSGSVSINVFDPDYNSYEYVYLDFYINQSYFDMENFDFENNLIFEFYTSAATITNVDNCESEGGTFTLFNSQYASCDFPPEVRPTKSLVINTEPLYLVNVNSTMAKDSTGAEISIDIPSLSINCSGSTSNCYYEGSALNQMIDISISGIPDDTLYNFIGWTIRDFNGNIIETKGPDSSISVLYDQSLYVELNVEEYVTYNLNLTVSGGYNLEHVVVTENGVEIEDCYGTCNIQLRNNNRQIELTPFSNGGSFFSSFSVANTNLVQPSYSFNSNDPVNNSLLTSSNDFNVETNFENSSRINLTFSQQHLTTEESNNLSMKYLVPGTTIKTVGDDLFYLDLNAYTIKYSSISNPQAPTFPVGSFSDYSFLFYNSHGTSQYSILIGNQNGPSGLGKYIFNLDYLNKTLTQIQYFDACEQSNQPLIKTGVNTGLTYCMSGYSLKVFSYIVDLTTNIMTKTKIYDSVDNPGWIFSSFLGGNQHGLVFTGALSGAGKVFFIRADGTNESMVKTFNWIYDYSSDESRIYFVTDSNLLFTIDLSIGLVSSNTRSIPSPANGIYFYNNFLYDFYANQGKQIREYSLTSLDNRTYIIEDPTAQNCFPLNVAIKNTDKNIKNMPIPLIVGCDSYAHNGSYKIFMLDRDSLKFIKLIDTIRNQTGVDVQTTLLIDNTLFLVFKNTYQTNYSQLYKIDLLNLKNSREIFKAKPISFVPSPPQNINFIKVPLQSQFALKASDNNLFFVVKQRDLYSTQTDGVFDSEETLFYSIDISN